jgi:hypothetical protein
MKITSLGKTIGIFLASYAVLLILFSQFGPYYFKLFEGIFRHEVELFFPQFKVSSLEAETYEGQKMISLSVRLTENIILPDGTVLHSKDRPYTSKTIAVNEYLHPIIILSILAAWPGITLRDRFKVFLYLLPFLVIVEMLDIPFVLATRSEESVRAGLLRDPEAGKSLASYWVAFLHTGGRAALSILAIGLAFVCFYLGRFWRSRTPESMPTGTALRAQVKVGRNEPCPCGSGKKYKNCCELKKAQQKAGRRKKAST